jgi:hypothetical protein
MPERFNGRGADSSAVGRVCGVFAAVNEPGLAVDAGFRLKHTSRLRLRSRPVISALGVDAGRIADYREEGCF